MAKEKSKWISVLKILLILIILSFFLSMIISLSIGGDFENLDGNVALIEISGLIMSKDGNFMFDEVTSADETIKLIKKANKKDEIKAIIFEINSPGGSAVASDEIAREIKKINKTTVAWIREVGASGGYWIASSTDYIIANRMSITGSIGVIASYLGFSGFLDEHNITYERLVSGNLKDIGSPLKQMTGQEKKLFQKSLDKIHDFFIEEIANNRNLKEKEVRKIATGLFYLGSEAKELGLVDELGSKQEVIDYLEDKIEEEVDIITYKKDKGFFDALSNVISKNFFFIGKGIGNSFFSQADKPQSLSVWA